MRVAATIALVSLVLGACGGSGETALLDDLGAATEIVQAPVSVVEPVGKDRYAFVASTENRIDAFVIDSSEVQRFGTYREPQPADEVRFVRDPIARGALAPVIDPASEMVILLIPLLDPTQELLIDFDARFIGLDEEGAVVTSDFEPDVDERLGELFELARSEGVPEAEALAAAARALFDDATDDFATRAADIVEG